jgi:mono/diheme cytochrome c family protein
MGCSKPPELVAPEPGFERMIDQRRGAPYRGTDASPPGAMMRTPPLGTVAQDTPAAGPATTGIGPDGYCRHLPIPVDEALIRRGQERFAIVCAACHGELGDGDTVVADHMDLVRPRDLLDPRIRSYPVGEIFHVITAGYGLMASHADLLPVRDRWAVAAYVKVLQLSQHAEVATLPEAQRRRLHEQLP